MPFTTAQLTRGADYALKTFDKKEPIDQINIQHVALDWLVKHKIPSTFGNGSFKEPLFIDNDSNTQNYFGADQVTFNERDPNKWTDFTYYNLHDGFWFDEDRLIQAGIRLTDDGAAMPTLDEQQQLIDLLKQSHRAVKNAMQVHLAFEFYRDGSQSAKAAPGFEHIIDPTPAVSTVGGIDAAVYTWWQNNTNLAIVAADVVSEMQTTWDDCMRYGGKIPNKIVAGKAFVDNYRVQAGVTINREITNGGNGKGGVSLDPSVTNLYFHGVPVEWDPTLDALDTLLSTTTRTKTCYFLNDSVISLRPLKGEWMRDRKPQNLPDRYVTYFGRTAKYGLTTNQRNALAVLQIA